MIKTKKKLKEEVVSKNDTVEVSKIDNLSVSFGNEDMNKVVEKINELINKLNGN